VQQNALIYHLYPHKLIMQKPILPDEKPSTSTLSGRLLALDIGSKRVGVALSDELNITTRPLPPLLRTNWKQLLISIQNLCRDYDVQALVIGLPLHLNGSESLASQAVRHLARVMVVSVLGTLLEPASKPAS